MEEKTTAPVQAGSEAPAAEEKPHESKSYLVFYVIGLFCVALVLILLSYVTQVRSDRRLNELNSQLTTQASAVEGANARVQVLQETVEEQNSRIAAQNAVIAAMQEAMGVESEGEMVDAAGKLARQNDALYQIAMAQKALADGDMQSAKTRVDALIAAYGKDMLDGSAADPLLTAESAALFSNVYEQTLEPAE